MKGTTDLLLIAITGLLAAILIVLALGLDFSPDTTTSYCYQRDGVTSMVAPYDQCVDR